MDTITINISEAKTNLSKYASLVKEGKTVILAERNIPFAQITPLVQTSEDIAEKRKRMIGDLQGKVTVSGNINEPLTKDELQEWYNSKLVS